MKALRTASICLLNIIFLVLESCSGPDPVDSRQITDSEGLNIDLEWTTGGSVTQAKQEVDLDLTLLKGSNVVDQAFTLSFERVEIKDIYADGEYTLKIEVAEAKTASDFTVYVSGIKTFDKKQYEGTTTASDDGVSIEFLTITKTGTKYIINR
jgi:hypothetical protein